MTAVLCADYLYICHNYLEVCKLHNCSETLLVLSEINDAFDSSSALHLVVNPVKRFVAAVDSSYSDDLFAVCLC